MTDEGAPLDGSKADEAYGEEEQPGQPVLGTTLAPLLRGVLDFCPGHSWWQRLFHSERGLHKGLCPGGGAGIGRRGWGALVPPRLLLGLGSSFGLLVQEHSEYRPTWASDLESSWTLV
jgi:hypothetical protein